MRKDSPQHTRSEGIRGRKPRTARSTSNSSSRADASHTHSQSAGSSITFSSQQMIPSTRTKPSHKSCGPSLHSPSSQSSSRPLLPSGSTMPMLYSSKRPPSNLKAISLLPSRNTKLSSSRTRSTTHTSLPSTSPTSSFATPGPLACTLSLRRFTRRVSSQRQRWHTVTCSTMCLTVPSPPTHSPRSPLHLQSPHPPTPQAPQAPQAQPCLLLHRARQQGTSRRRLTGMLPRTSSRWTSWHTERPRCWHSRSRT
mmetsp:Transcript_20732/g.42142  ORF Transcript_20732/g.42142 Transcript_20732/m.42142 type:complete len:253 (-) Transcript_20732:190-948(-)